MSVPTSGPGEAQTGLGWLLEQLVRLDVSVDFALLGLIQIVEEAPTAGTLDLSDELKAAVRAEGSWSDEDLLAASQAVASGDFAYEVAIQFLLGLASAVGPNQLRTMLNTSEQDLEWLFENGCLIAREGAATFATPSWLVDTSEGDGLTYGSGQVLSEDAPYFATTFGGGVFVPRPELTAEAPLSPECWLAEGLDVGSVVDIILSFPVESSGGERA